jgi:hypothetical protein
MFKWTRRIIVWGVLGSVAVVGVGWFFGGRHVLSYMRTSKSMIEASVKDSIPIEFEIQRAKDLLEDLIPELRANLRLVAAEEVEVANLEKDLAEDAQAIASETGKVQYLRDTLKQHQVSYTIQDHPYSRAEIIEELARRFESLRTAELLHKGKQDLLKNRKRSLDAALKKLDHTRLARIELESQIEALEAQFRLIQAQSSGSEFRLDESKLTQTQEIIAELKKRLEVAQKVMAREARFVENIPLGTVNEANVVERIDGYFSAKVAAAAVDGAANLELRDIHD